MDDYGAEHSGRSNMRLELPWSYHEPAERGWDFLARGERFAKGEIAYRAPNLWSACLQGEATTTNQPQKSHLLGRGHHDASPLGFCYLLFSFLASGFPCLRTSTLVWEGAMLCPFSILCQY